MKIRKIITSLNILLGIIYLLPVNKLDLFLENYSTLSLNAKGYFYCLSVGVLTGLLFYYENKDKNLKRARLYLIMMILGTIVPHHVPYNLQGNLHLLLAYFSFAIISIITYLNVFTNKKILNILTFNIFISLMFYLKFSMVNTISEIIFIYTILGINYYLFIASTR